MCPRRGCSRTSTAASRPRSYAPRLGSKTTRISIAADRDRALPRVEAKELGRSGCRQLNHLAERDSSLAHAEMMEHRQPVLDARRAVWDQREVVAADRLVLVPGIRHVVSGEDRERPSRERVPEAFLVGHAPWWRREDVLGALEVGPLEHRLLGEEVPRCSHACSIDRPRAPRPPSPADTAPARVYDLDATAETGLRH